MEFLIVSGLSGAGKTGVIKIVEDLGYYTVDNMPAELIPAFAELYLTSYNAERSPKVALVTDIRGGHSFDALFASLALIHAMNCNYKILFVEAKPDIIIRRYKESRRPHPLTRNGESLETTVERENELLLPVRAKADFVVDTSSLSPAALRNLLSDLLWERGKRPMLISVISFGYKYGLPPESDLVYDVRFLPNPYHIAELRDLSGLDGPVFDFVSKWPQTRSYMEHLTLLMDFLIPQYQEEGRSCLIVAVGCTGGRHRSVTAARLLHQYFESKGFYSLLTHRDVKKDLLRS